MYFIKKINVKRTIKCVIYKENICNSTTKAEHFAKVLHYQRPYSFFDSYTQLDSNRQI